MPKCRKCGSAYSKDRAALGYKTCTKCGVGEAEVETKDKQGRVAPAFNKGGYQYLGDRETAKRAALDIGRKTSAAADIGIVNYRDKVDPQKHFTIRTVKTLKEPPIRIKKKKAIGVYWVDQDRYVWYEGVDPKKVGATRQARFRGK